MTDRKRFEAFVYVKLDTALTLLQERENLTESYCVPEEFLGNKKAVLSRHLITPNFEVIRFLSIVPASLEVVFLECLGDRFSSNNDWKYSLGRVPFYKGLNRKEEILIETKRIIDFHKYDGKKIADVNTLWGQSLVDFHREFFSFWNKNNHDVVFFNASPWFGERKALEYYCDYIKIFVKHGILFENFMLESNKEKRFTKEVFLPAFIRTWIETGYKPIIVSLEPTEIEGEKFWYCHPSKSISFIDEKLK